MNEINENKGKLIENQTNKIRRRKAKRAKRKTGNNVLEGKPME